MITQEMSKSTLLQVEKYLKMVRDRTPIPSLKILRKKDSKKKRCASTSSVKFEVSGLPINREKWSFQFNDDRAEGYPDSLHVWFTMIYPDSKKGIVDSVSFDSPYNYHALSCALEDSLMCVQALLEEVIQESILESTETELLFED